ncbi:MAG: FAD-binding oxidoreductase [Bryobacteraceae bacterium]
MKSGSAKSDISAQLTTAAIRKFAESLKGEVVLPGDKRYGKARRVWNHAVNRRPAIIARCADEEDVVRSVEFARRNELPTAVRSGGHSFAGHGVCDDGMVIDLSPMKRAKVDPVSCRITIEPGVVAGELDCLTQAFRMAVPLGSCPTVGVAGYALGGGESSLTTKFGYACDNITRARIVTADGRVLTAREGEHPELFWAVRGAGANFGVVTSIEFRLNPIESVLSGHLSYPIRQAREVLRYLNEFAPTIPDDLFLLAAVLPYPGERMLDVVVVWTGEVEKGERILRPLRTYLKPFKDTIRAKAYLDEQREASDVPSGDHSSHRKSGHFQVLCEDIINVIEEYASNAPSEVSGITMMYWHGAWCSKPHDNAFGFRRTGYEFWVHSYWQQAEERKKSWAWVEDFFAAMRPFSSGAVYVNGLENEGDDRVRAAYGNKYQRLARIKAKYDADNFFRVNQNIKPASL